MAKRKLLKDVDPQAFDTMLGFEKYLTTSSLSKIHAELIKIRVSQINGCSYCIDKHIQDALKYGEQPRRIFLLSVWRDTFLFSKEEQAILALVEEITLIAQHGVSDEVYDTAITVLGQQYTTEVMMAIIAMNAWNRVGITTGREPE
ncbi:carboxymuconolactone decarboxylase family protein [Sphingobacterium sp. SRCM116780]|uniref:carboxymuconolactone decarboxylase family protein n=1 Tax=Sphingobacterium sp. SRCM116780 TaxID=2907623 RepID=UPI001F45FA38|nr:carboxymuconolactone decarboxylase family protein [Sphingobacterium sp. SRCM116780]UIR56975.1 carboxymuconolactone decarboxylase family protein [Sphingobacterium sp. SRCM116780]